MKSFAAAIAFLTVLPVPQQWVGGMDELEDCVPFFPVVGLLIGGTLAAIAAGLAPILPPLPASVLLIMALAGASGALHLDGLADTADGFLSARPREQALDIMRDSCSGAMGVLALIFVIVMKTTCLASIAPGLWWKAVLLVPLAGRFALILSMTVLSYARPEGLGSAFYEKKHRFALIVGLITLVAVGWGTFQTPGLITVGFTIATVLIFSLWSQRRIGGATGDTLGATCEIAETACLVGLCAF